MRIQNASPIGSVGAKNPWVLIAEANPTSDATIDFTGLEKYDRLFVSWRRLESDTDNRQAAIQFSVDGGATFNSGASDYYFGGRASTTSLVDVAGTASFIRLSSEAAAGNLGTAGGEVQHGYMYINSVFPSSASALDDGKPGNAWYFTSGFSSAGTLATLSAGCMLSANIGDNILSGIRFTLQSSGNYIGGTVRCWGVGR